MSGTARAWRRGYLSAIVALNSAAWAVVNGFEGDWTWTAVHGAGAVANAGCFVLLRRMDDANRKARRNRDDSRPGGSAGLPAAGISEATGEGPSLSEREQAEPFVGWKTHPLIWTPSRGWTLHSYIGAARAVATARCRQDVHAAPDANCLCGFNAWKDRAEVGGGAIALLEVELYGRVIVTERGYRAEKQRILAVYVTSACALCGGRADGLAVHAPYDQTLIDARHWNSPADRVRPEPAPRCAAHVGPDDVLIPLDGIATCLGTEVRWLNEMAS